MTTQILILELAPLEINITEGNFSRICHQISMLIAKKEEREDATKTVGSVTSVLEFFVVNPILSDLVILCRLGL